MPQPRLSIHPPVATRVERRQATCNPLRRFPRAYVEVCTRQKPIRVLPTFGVKLLASFEEQGARSVAQSRMARLATVLTRPRRQVEEPKPRPKSQPRSKQDTKPQSAY